MTRPRNPSSRKFAVHVVECDYLRFAKLALKHNRNMSNEALYQIQESIKRDKKINS